MAKYRYNRLCYVNGLPTRKRPVYVWAASLTEAIREFYNLHCYGADFHNVKCIMGE